MLNSTFICVHFFLSTCCSMRASEIKKKMRNVNCTLTVVQVLWSTYMDNGVTVAPFFLSFFWYVIIKSYIRIHRVCGMSRVVELTKAGLCNISSTDGKEKQQQQQQRPILVKFNSWTNHELPSAVAWLSNILLFIQKIKNKIKPERSALWRILRSAAHDVTWVNV